MKNYIFEDLSNKLNKENDIDNIIKLINCLEEKGKEKEAIINEFLQK
jgi:hypothetical protein